MPNIMYHKIKNTSPKTPYANIPIPTNKANSFGQLVKEGIAFGTGTAIARNVTDSVFQSMSPTTDPIIPTKSSTTDPIIPTKSSTVVSNTDKDNYCDFLKEQLIHCVSYNTNNCDYLQKMHNTLCKTNI